MDYRRRVLDDLFDEIFPAVAAIAIEGAKGVGKTATASRHAATVLSLANPRTKAAVAGNFDLVAEVDRPVFVDEWQLVPDVWERIRQAVDANPEAGAQFLLAGSAGLAAGVRIHSGAGRIVGLTMRPMSIAERGIEQTTVSLGSILQGGARISGSTAVTTRGYVEEILRSGFPGIRNLPELGRKRELDSYLARIVDHDLPEAGFVARRPAAMRSWLRAYAAATATTADYTKILDAATAGESNKPARSTTDAYREQLTRLFILDPIEAWAPTFTPLKRLAASPKHHLVDPALAARVVGVGVEGLLLGEGDRVATRTGTWLGALFESLVVQSVRVYADSNDGRTFHLRTQNGDREVDIIVERDDTRCLAIEVKLSDSIGNEDVKHLNWLARELGPRLVDRVVVNTGPFAYRRPDGIAVVPLALLGP